VLDWAADQISNAERQLFSAASCPQKQGAEASRDALFLDIATGKDPSELIERSAEPLVANLQSADWKNPAKLYAALEFLYTVRSTEHTDFRENAREFFSSLPIALLLSIKPEQLDHPDWRMHVAALALVDIDPNLGASQFLQGWAMENRQMIREGPGVAYEFLWADPYLPGVGYENLDPWLYSAEGSLFARTDWNIGACWIHIGATAVEQENCPPDWQRKAMSFGRLTLIPFNGTCVQVPARRNDAALIIWKLQPGQALHFMLDNAPGSAVTDRSGMWKPPANVEGRVCTSLDTLKIPKAHKSARD
jgi:hypothetical protein